MQVPTVEFSEVRVAALEHCGPTKLIDKSVGKFIQWRMQSGPSPLASSRTLGIPYGTPATPPAQALRFAMCGERHEAVAPNEFGIREMVIPDGRYLAVRP